MEEEHFTGFVFPFLTSLLNCLWLAPVIILIRYFYLGGELSDLLEMEEITSLASIALTGIVTLAFAFLPLAVMIGRWHPEWVDEPGGVRAAGFLVSCANTGVILLSLSGHSFSSPEGHIDVWCSLFMIIGGHVHFIEWTCAIIGALLGLVALAAPADL